MKHTLFGLLILILQMGTVQSCLASEPTREQLIQQEISREDAGDFAGALDIAKRILSANPRDIETINVVAGLYGKLGKFPEELVWAKKAIAIDGNFHLAYLNYGNALTYLRRFEEARIAFEKANALAPRDPMPSYSLGTLAEEQKQLTVAVSHFEHAVSIDPKFEPALFSLAAMYANAKRYDSAITTLDRLLAQNPNDQEAKLMRQRIKVEQARDR